MSELRKTNKIVLKIPIFLTITYLIFSLVVYRLCPYNWPTKRPILFYGLNFLYILALFMGYNLGIKKTIRFRYIKWTVNKTNKLIKIISWLVVVNFIMYFIYVLRAYGFKHFDVVGLIEEMAAGIRQPGFGYYRYYERIRVLDGPDVWGGYVYTIFSLLWGFFKNGVAILSMLYFKQMKLWGKIFSVFYLLLVASYQLSIGNNLQILHVFLLLELPGIMEFFVDYYYRIINIRKIVRFVLRLVIGLILFAMYFGWMQESRSIAYGYEVSEYKIANLLPEIAQTTPETQTPAEYSLLQKKMYNFWISFSSYLSQGYYGMSQALTLDWTPMFGIGNSMFIVDMISGNWIDINQYTFQGKLEKFGWDSRVQWHSMYTWIANDVSFYGVVIIMFLFGLIFGEMFRDAVVIQNPFAQASMFFFILALLFAPCNNQIGQSNENLCAFFLLVGIWSLCGRTTEAEVQKHISVVHGGV